MVNADIQVLLINTLLQSEYIQFIESFPKIWLSCIYGATFAKVVFSCENLFSKLAGTFQNRRTSLLHMTLNWFCMFLSVSWEISKLWIWKTQHDSRLLSRDCKISKNSFYICIQSITWGKKLSIIEDHRQSIFGY